MKLVVFEQEKTCAPCRALKPHVKAAAEEINISLEFKEVGDNWDDCIKYGVKSTPTVFIMDNEEIVAEVKSRTTLSLISELRIIYNG